MAFQMSGWSPPKFTGSQGISLNYVPTQQQIGSPQNNVNLDAMLKNLQTQMAAIQAPPVVAAAPAAPAVDPRAAQLAREYRDSRWASGGRTGEHASGGNAFGLGDRAGAIGTSIGNATAGLSSGISSWGDRVGKSIGNFGKSLGIGDGEGYW